MKVRLASALVLVPVVLAVLWIGGLVWVVAIALLAAVGGRELENAGRRLSVTPTSYLISACAAFAVAASGVTGHVIAAPLDELVGVLVGSAMLGLAIALVVMVSLLDQLRRRQELRSTADWAFNLSGAVYLGVLFSFLALLRGLPHGLSWTLILLVLIWTNDSAAYAGGRLFGRHLFAPSISPKKTWEGFAAGMAITVSVGASLPSIATRLQTTEWMAARSSQELAFVAEIAPWILALGAAVVSVVGPLGDLSKSFLKREAGVKDFGTLIPGHGGVLDRLDSMMFAAPVVYAVAVIGVGIFR
jgi:phosphatidate cytidylyltransferase